VPSPHVPALHLRLRERLAHVAPGYRAANRDILDSFPVAA